MKSSTVLRILVVNAALSTTLGSLAVAQSRVFPPLPPSSDVKTAPEPDRPPEPRATRTTLSVPDEPTSVQSNRPHRAIDPNAPVSGARRVDHTVMHYDAPGDGSLWARGASYKASFDGAGATYFPLFGSRQPRHQPMTLSPDSVTRGETQLALQSASNAVRQLDHVELDRGSFVERYDLSPKSVEQSFVFASLPGAGDLVIRVPIARAEEPVTVTREPDHLEITSELGQVSYGRATAVDARGHTLSLPTQYSDGAITIRVDAAFLATAAMPLVVDPIVSTFSIDTSSYDDYWCDVAYDANTQRWLATYEEAATVHDTDIYYEMLNSAGSSMWGGYVDVTTNSAFSESCGNLAGAHQFLVAYNLDSGGFTIRGRTIEATISSIGGEFLISGTESGDKMYPAVGGDPYPSLPSNYCVAYQREYSSSDFDVLVRLVAPNSTLIGTSAIFLSNSGGTVDENPAISKSNGSSIWTIAWDRYHSINSADIWAGRISYSGAIIDNPFQLTSGNFDLQARVSSPLTGTNRVMIAFERDYGTDFDIQVMVQEGTTPIAAVDLSVLETTGFFARQQTFPSVDSDGQHFLVAYSEQHATGSTDFDVFADDLYLSGNTLGISQQHMALGVFAGIDEGGTHVASTQGSGGANRSYMVTWSRESTTGNYDVIGALVNGVEGGPVNAYCFGDGSGAACPCNNFGATGHGCASSVNAAGARLFAAGEASTTNDQFILEADGLPASASCLFFQGTLQGAGAAFGDGLRCATGTTIRLGGHAAFNGFCSYPNFGDLPVSVKGGVDINGATRTYQVWYRNSVAFCTPSTFNLSNGLRAVWTR